MPTPVLALPAVLPLRRAWLAALLVAARAAHLPRLCGTIYARSGGCNLCRLGAFATKTIDSLRILFGENANWTGALYGTGRCLLRIAMDDSSSNGSIGLHNTPA